MSTTTALIGNQIPDQFPTNNWTIPAMWWGLVWMPPKTASSPALYPLIIHLHGLGEEGTGLAGLTKLISTSLPQRIANGFQPKSTKGTEFIVVSPQCPSYAPQWLQLQYILPDILKRYPVDPNRVIVTGYSYGGYGAWTCLTEDINFAKKIAAIAPVSAATLEGDKIARIVPNWQATKMPIFEVCGTADGFIGPADAYKASLVAAGDASFEEDRIAGVGHSAWNQFFDPNYKFAEIGGTNSYDWFDQQSLVPAAPPVVIPPVVVPPVIPTLFFITLKDGKKFTLFTDLSYTLQ